MNSKWWFENGNMVVCEQVARDTARLYDLACSKGMVKGSKGTSVRAHSIQRAIEQLAEPDVNAWICGWYAHKYA